MATGGEQRSLLGVSGGEEEIVCVCLGGMGAVWVREKGLMMGEGNESLPFDLCQ